MYSKQLSQFVFLSYTTVAMVLAACSEPSSAGDVDGSADTTGEAPIGTTTHAATTGQTPDPASSADSTSGADSTSTTEPTSSTALGDDTGSGSEGSTTGCGSSDPCQSTADCGVGFDCRDCVCVAVGEEVCPEGWGGGEYADCLLEGAPSCPATSALEPICLIDDIPGSGSSCSYMGCSEPCDSPAPPDQAFASQVACANISGDAASECFIDCSGGAGCPVGMSCFFDQFCLHGEPPKPIELPPYGDCLNEVGNCQEGAACVTDSQEFGVCGAACDDASDCPNAPASGTAQPQCIENTVNFCSLSCGNGETCPDGMACVELYDPVEDESFGTFCVWEGQ